MAKHKTSEAPRNAALVSSVTVQVMFASGWRTTFKFSALSMHGDTHLMYAFEYIMEHFEHCAGFFKTMIAETCFRHIHLYVCFLHMFKSLDCPYTRTLLKQQQAPTIFFRAKHVAKLCYNELV